MARKGEDADDDSIPFPGDIDMKKVMKQLPLTTDSVLSPSKNYKDYTFDELRALAKRG